ncbi:MAG: hypothetical protein SWK76_01180 [Actinomycetota bacterium]|nr:hypothetical protein [Actinomycetota bacterium]
MGSGFFVTVESGGPVVSEIATYFKSGSTADGWSVLGLDSRGE